MAIELESSGVARQSAAMFAADSSVSETGAKGKLTALLGGASLTVTHGAVTDLEALLAHMKNDQEKTKFSVLVGSLNAIGQALTDAQKANIEEGLALSDEADKLEKDVARQSAAMFAADSSVSETGAKGKLTALLGGASLTVTHGAVTDLEALLAHMKNDQEKTKFSVLVGSLNAIGQALTDAQKANIEEGLALSDEADKLEKDVAGMKASMQAAEADAVVLQTKIDMLQKEIDIAVQEGKDHNELVQKQKALRKELDAKKQVIADTQGKIAEATNQISSLKVKISALAESLGANTLKTIAKEFADVFGTMEKTETAEETERKERKAEAVDVFRGIREALDKFEDVLNETIEENRTHLA